MIYKDLHFDLAKLKSGDYIFVPNRHCTTSNYFPSTKAKILEVYNNRLLKPTINYVLNKFIFPFAPKRAKKSITDFCLRFDKFSINSCVFFTDSGWFHANYCSKQSLLNCYLECGGDENYFDEFGQPN